MDINKIKQDIVDLESKKQALLLSLQSDIEAIDVDMDKEFCEIGKNAYKLAFEGEANLSALSEDFKRIDDFKEMQDAKEKKKSDIVERYDDEISILEKLIPKEPEPAPLPPPPPVPPTPPVAVMTPMTSANAAVTPAAPAASTGFCTNCGKPYTYGEDMFCLKCGTKLSQS